MAEDPKIGRRFQYDSVDLYYKFKISKFPETSANPDLILPSQTFASIAELCSHLHSVAESQSIPLDTCSTWGEYIASLPKDIQIAAWKFREYIFATAMLYVGSLLAKRPSVVEIVNGLKRRLPSDFDIGAHSFTIVGSAKLESDIDITIEGARSSVLISIIEDLFRTFTEECGIPIRCWDVEFYGDFHILQSMFVNISKFNALQRLIMLKYALISYYRSTGQGESQAPEVNASVAFLARKFLTLQTGNDGMYESLIQQAYDTWRMEAPSGVLDRNQFYRQLATVEANSLLVSEYVKQTKNGITESNNALMESNGISVGELAFETFQSLTIANMHRAESYILPSTAIHVVEMEQKRVSGSGGLPKAWFASNARIGIDKFGYILSAIEQLGYLTHYHPDGTACNKKGIKYFGRYVRALVNAGLLKPDSEFVETSRSLNAFRSSEDPATICGQDVHVLLQGILNAMQDQAGGRRRTRRRSRRRLHRI